MPEGLWGFALDLSLPIGVASAQVTVPAPPTTTSAGTASGVGLVLAGLHVECNGKVVWDQGKFTPSEGLTAARLAPGAAGGRVQHHERRLLVCEQDCLRAHGDGNSVCQTCGLASWQATGAT